MKYTKTKNSTSHSFRMNHIVISRMFGVIVSCLGFVVLLGWYLHNITLIQVHPSFVPMQYNTALGFLLSGISLLLAQFQYARFAAFLGAVVALIGGLTLIEYMSLVDLGIDQLFMQHYVTTQTSHPGRMAPNTALCFFLSGIVLLVVNLNRRFNLVSILGSVITGLGFIALFGYLTGIETAYGWGHLTHMAVHTSVGFLLLGIGIVLWGITFANSSIEPSYIRNVSSMAMVLIVLVLALWQALNDWEDRRLRQEVQNQLTHFHDSFELSLTYQIQALERMALRWQYLGGTPQAEWQFYTELYVRHFKVFQAIEWVDESFHVRWVAPQVGNEAAQGLDLAFEDHRKQALNKARDQKTVTLSQPIELVQGGLGFLIYTPLFINQQFNGFILGVIRLEHMVSLLTENPDFRNNFQLQLYNGEKFIAGNGTRFGDTASRFRATAEIKYNEIQWRAEMVPTKNHITDLRTPLPNLVLFSGMSVSILLLFLYTLRQREQAKSIQLQKEIGKREQVEKLLNQSRNELQLILDSAQEGIYGLDLNGNTTFSNPTACLLTGYTHEEMFGHSQHALIHHTQADGNANPREKCHIYAAINQGIAQHVDDEVFWRKDGSSFSVEYTSSPLRDIQGNITGAVVTFQDISRRKQHEKELRQYTRELERSNKELDDFAYVASHDLKAPLRGIMQLTNWIEEDIRGQLEEQTKNYMDLLKNRIIRLEQLLDDLLAYSRIGRKHGDFKAVNVTELVTEVFQLLDPPQAFTLVCDTDMPTLNTLAVPLEQLLRNLINNAIKHHNSDHGTVTITAKPHENGIEFTVADDGPGIPENQHERVFSIFQTLKPRDEVEGSGMGLAIVKKILDVYGRSIKIESDGIRGTKFHFTWPTETLLRKTINE